MQRVKLPTIKKSTLQRAMTVGSTNEAPSGHQPGIPITALLRLTRDEAVGERRQGVEDEGDPKDLLLAGKPGGDDERESGKGQRLEEAKEETADGEAGKAVRRGDAHRDDAPNNDVDRNDFAGLETLHQLRVSSPGA